MADNTELNPASGGDLISTDDIGGVKVQRVKMQTGADGSATDVSDANPVPTKVMASGEEVGGSSALGLQVQVTSLPAGESAHDIPFTSGAPLVIGARASAAAPSNVSADNDAVMIWALRSGALATQITAGGALVGGDASNGLDVDITRVPAPLSTTGGGTEAAALRVTLASDSTGLVSVDDNGGSLTVDNAALAVVGGGTEATALRVTVASDSTGVLSVDDNGSSLTVDNPVLSVVGSGTQAAAQRVTLATDAPGVVVEDAVSAGDPTGLQTMVRTRSAPAIEVSTSGDHAALSGPVEGGVWAALLGDGAPAERIGGTTANGLDVDVTRVPAPLSTTGGGTEATALRVTIATDSTGVLSIDDNGGSVTVDGTVTVNTNSGAILSNIGDVATSAASLGKAEDAGHSSGDAGVMALAVRRDTAASGASNDGDYATLNVDANGRLHANSLVQGQAATDAAVSGNPVLSGNRADASTPTAVSTNGDAVPNWADLNGRQIVLIGAPNALTTRGLLNRTDNSAADVIAAAGAGVKIAVMGILVTNAHATVSTKVSIRDGATTKVTGYAAAAGGGFSTPAGGCPIFTTAANAAVTAICGTTGADVDINVWGYLTP